MTAAWPTLGPGNAAPSRSFTSRGKWDLRPAGAATASALTFQLAASTGGSGTGRTVEPSPAFGAIAGAVTLMVGLAVEPTGELGAVVPGGVFLALPRQPAKKAKGQRHAIATQ